MKLKDKLQNMWLEHSFKKPILVQVRELGEENLTSTQTSTVFHSCLFPKALT